MIVRRGGKLSIIRRVSASCRAGILMTLAVMITGCTTGDLDTAGRIVEGAQLVVFSMGDSFVSGEGNPDVVAANGGPAWLATAVPGAGICHRSFNNAHRMAIGRIADAWTLSDEEVYVNFACTGSTVRRGLRLARFGGASSVCDLPAGTPVPDPPVCGGSQIDAAAAFVADPANGVLRVDAVILSIGVNDLGFSRIVRACSTPFPLEGNCAQNAELRRMIEEGCDAGTNQPEPCGGQQSSLVGLDDLEEDVIDIIDRIQRALNPKSILLVGYPDPTRDFDGEFCNVWSDGYFVGTDLEGNLSPGGTQLGPVTLPFGAATQEITAEEAQFAFEDVLVPLNDALRNAADTSGIRFVDGAMEATAVHGVCAESYETVNSEAGLVTRIIDERWFHTFRDSYRYQEDIMGTLHPNIAGHEAISHLIEAELRDVLGLPAE